MATFTSTQNGNWTDPATWGESTDYPGSTTADDTVNIGHEVTYNTDNSSGNRYGTININTNGQLIVDTTQTTHLKLRGSIDLNAYNSEFHCGTEASPLSSSYTFTVEYDLASNGASDWLQYNSDGVVTKLYGSEKTPTANLNATASASQADLSFSTIPADWEAGDRLVVLSSSETGTARYTETEEVEISSISSNTATLTANLTNSHSSGTLVMNMTRNIRFISTTSTNQPGGQSRQVIQDFRNVEFKDIGSDYILAVSSRNDEANFYYRCTFSNAGNRSIYMGGASGARFQECISYNPVRHFQGQNSAGRYIFINCWFVDAENTSELQGRGSPYHFIGCIFACNRNNAVNNSNDRGHEEFRDCYFYGNDGHGINAYRVGYTLHNCYFGIRPDGVSQTNDDASIRSSGSLVRANDCLFNDSDILDTDTDGVMISSNHNQVAGQYRYFTGDTTYTVEEDNTTYRTSAPSIKLNPSEENRGSIHYIPLAVTSTGSVTVTVYGKASSASGWEFKNYPTARLTGCGLNDNDSWTVTDTNWNSLTLTGTSARTGTAMLVVTSYNKDAEFNIDDWSISIS